MENPDQDDLYLCDQNYIEYLNEPSLPLPIYDPDLFSDIELSRNRTAKEQEWRGIRNDGGKRTPNWKHKLHANETSSYNEKFTQSFTLEHDVKLQRKRPRVSQLNHNCFPTTNSKAQDPNILQYEDATPLAVIQRRGPRRRNKLNPSFIRPMMGSIEWLTFSEGKVGIEKLLGSLELKFESNSNTMFTALFASSTIGNLEKITEALGALTKEQYTKARGSANPFELIRKSIFINRSAVKLANIDVFCGLMTKPLEGKFFFADLCAGPGGFSSYFVWRAREIGIDAHGCCITASSEIDINPSVISEYGSNLSLTNGAKGDITINENISEFCDYVLKTTNEIGVNVVTADGSVSFNEWELNKENYMFRMCLCEVIIMLKILKPNGSFIMKTFELYNEFSISLIWVLRNVFAKITIFKPQTSRPSSAERFIVCKGFIKPDSDALYNHLMYVNLELSKKKGTIGNDFFLTFVNLSQVKYDKEFVSYVQKSNEMLEIAYNTAVRKINYAKCNNATIGTMYNHTIIAEEWFKILSIPPSPT